MSVSSLDFKKGNEVDEKNVGDISTGVVVNSVAEDTVEAAYECMSELHPNSLFRTTINFLNRHRCRIQKDPMEDRFMFDAPPVDSWWSL
jgi:hypothetical protein